MTENKKLKIVLLFGGTSPERAVSKSTASSIYTALQSMDYDVVLVDPAYGANQPESIEEFFSEKDYAPLSNRNYVEAINSKLFDEAGLVFLAIHGKYGEDGTIQSLLELRGKKYTGSKVLSSAISMDKMMSKILFQHYNILTPKWIIAEKNNTGDDAIAELIKNNIGFPCVIKPNDQGSTVGLTVCENKEQVIPAIKLALEFSSKALIEEFIPGRELTVAILESKALPVLEIKPKHGLYDYECKYTSGMSEYIVPADIPKETSDELKKQALLAFNALGCEVYARLDFRLSPDNKAYLLEINTLPGMTSTSLVPKMAKAVGLSFEDLIERIIRLSL
ncbi:MAG: D-alanine--D-alanine ligase [Ignavibacteriaceae bacterium]